MVCSWIEFVCRRPSPRVGGGGGDWREREVNQSYDGIASYDSDDDVIMTVTMMTVVMIMTVMSDDDDDGDDDLAEITTTSVMITCIVML